MLFFNGISDEFFSVFFLLFQIDIISIVQKGGLLKICGIEMPSLINCKFKAQALFEN